MPLLSVIREQLRSPESAARLDACHQIVAAAREGLTVDETCELARALALSGERIPLPADLEPYADVASTGGPASLSTLLSPVLVACCDTRVPKISALGSIAGAIDTLALLPGYDSSLSKERFLDVLGKCGFAHIAQTERICPADKLLVQVRRETNLMANRWLAAASLLSKKLVVFGTACVFDFRVGASGNIGTNKTEADEAAVLFQDVAKKLGIKIDFIFTDSDSLATSALGRLESLNLLHKALTNQGLSLSLDRTHISTCIDASARALALAHPSTDLAVLRSKIIAKVEDGTAYRVFVNHLAAQGSSEAELHAALNLRDDMASRTITASKNQLLKPSMVRLKQWFKTQQAILDRQGRQQLGLEILAEPETQVPGGTPVAVLRYPPQAVIEDPPL